AVPYLEHTFTHLSHGKQFDPEPWILLNLIFSGVAFYTGALVIIAQKAQSKKDKAREEGDAKHREELSQKQVELLEVNTTLTQEVHDLSQQIQKLVAARA